MHVAERAALSGEECPPSGNAFHHIRVGLCIHTGNAEGRAVWERFRSELLINPHRPGTRPTAFWVYDAPPDTPEAFKTGEPSQQEQAQYLHAHGLLASTERKKLPKEWFCAKPPSLKVIRNG
jgi:hypothetical protein